MVILASRKFMLDARAALPLAIIIVTLPVIVTAADVAALPTFETLGNDSRKLPAITDQIEIVGAVIGLVRSNALGESIVHMRKKCAVVSFARTHLDLGDQLAPVVHGRVSFVTEKRLLLALLAPTGVNVGTGRGAGRIVVIVVLGLLEFENVDLGLDGRGVNQREIVENQTGVRSLVDQVVEKLLDGVRADPLAKTGQKEV